MKKLSASDIKLILTQLELTHAELANEIGTNVTTVSRWVNSKAKPSGPAKKLLEPLLEQAKLLRDHGYASRCPSCGHWGAQITGKTKGSAAFDEINERKCEYCGNIFWPPA